MKRSDSERQMVGEAQRLKQNLRWGRGQLWVGAVGYIAMGLFWFMGDRTDERRQGVGPFAVLWTLYVLYRSARMMGWRSKLREKVRLLEGAGVLRTRRSD
ncbi:MAG TPA: hypothetical protein VLE43_09585 [Candidatus Saccharimonadia bacterium]|nr:hypothetical protein [Candidatus Saccharimonadia bacterium]